MSAKLHDLGHPMAKLVHRTLEGLGTPRALTSWLLFLHGEHDQLVELDVDPADYSDGARFALDYQATKLLSKANFLSGLPSPREKAIAKFRESEEACRATNRRVVTIIRGSSPDGINGIFHTAGRLIASVLGEVPYESIIDSCGWGPGVSSSCKGRRTTGYDKFASVPEVTPELLPVAHHVINAWHPWPSVVLGAVDDLTGLPLACSVIPNALMATRGNKVAFVPKNSKTDRAIAVEPTINAFLQKGIGSVIRRKLRKHGVDLSDQGRNRALARKGAIDGSLCTIDLESASDTIATELVRKLLPDEWFLLLDRARCKFGRLDDSYFMWEKFSSMGNGFTFELESLLFWALVKAVAAEVDSSEPISVYGDDIICDVSIYRRVVEVFAFCGFKVNAKKSFATGPFRESCGEDFFRGLNVRPYFLKEVPDGPLGWMNIANSLRQHSTRWTEGMWSDPRYRNAWLFCVSQVPKELRFFGPANASGVFWIPQSEKKHRTWNGHAHRVKCLDTVPRKTHGRKVGALLLASWLYAKDSPTHGKFSHRGVWTIRERVHSIPEWVDIGAWGSL
jgi:hypothetical protein